MEQKLTIYLFDLAPSDLNHRLDHLVQHHLKQLSRAEIKKLIETGQVSVDNTTITKASTNITQGLLLKVTFKPQQESIDLPQEQPLNILYEDTDILVINKAAGMLVHPGSGQKDGTLLNALLHRYPESQNLPRAGIVHRLDKLTSGVLIIAKTYPAYLNLIQNFKQRTVSRTYHAIAHGVIHIPKIVEEPIGRHPKKRTLMSVHDTGSFAKTIFKPIKKWAKATLLECELHTGKTHQIRVHAEFIRHPLYGDPQYGRQHHLIIPFKRQALHAIRLQLKHPINSNPLDFNCPYPEDFQNLIDQFDRLEVNQDKSPK